MCPYSCLFKMGYKTKRNELIMGAPSIPELLIVLIILIFPILIYGPIAKKAGFSRWWGLAMIVPILSIIILWMFAFVKWPNEEKGAAKLAEKNDRILGEDPQDVNDEIVNNTSYCTYCGNQISETDNFCTHCGKQKIT